MVDPVQQGEAMRLWGEALQRAAKRSDLSEEAKWVIGLLCTDKDGKLEMPELTIEAGIFHQSFSQALRTRVAALFSRMRMINGMSAHGGIEFTAADIIESGMKISIWDDAANAKIIHRVADVNGVRYVISPQLASMEFTPRARNILDDDTNRQTNSFLSRFGQPEHGAGKRGGRE